MLDTGFVKIYRSLLNWEWYDDVVTKTVFLHLLLTVSIDDQKWHGIVVKRGSRVSSYAKLAEETKLSIQQIRTAISHLESTGELTRSKHAKFTVFAINNYDEYQQATGKSTVNQQGANRVTTRYQQQYKKNKKNKNDIYIVRNSNFENVEDAKSEKPDAKPYQEIVDYLNQKAGTSYRSNSKATQAIIRARLAEGYTVEDFKRVIDNKCTDWIGTQWEEYLRPSTLFGTKFENYLNRKQTKQQKQRQTCFRNNHPWQFFFHFFFQCHFSPPVSRNCTSPDLQNRNLNSFRLMMYSGGIFCFLVFFLPNPIPFTSSANTMPFFS